jgi:1,4-dihydroxy-6-naphthoate synthase
VTVAIPGTMTSAWLQLQMAVGKVPFEVIPFDRIIESVVAGRHEAGLIIHEGQLTYGASGLHKVLDLGEWWQARTGGLPLPLGGNAVRRALGPEVIAEVAVILRRSIEYGLSHREEAVAHSLGWARDMGTELADRFVGMYVNDLTLDYGERGRRGVELFLREAAECGLIPALPAVEFVG